MTPEERTQLIVNDVCRSHVFTREQVRGLVLNQIRKAEAAAERRGEQRGKRAAYEDMATWCEEMNALRMKQREGQKEPFARHGFLGSACTYQHCADRARELGGGT